MQNTIVLFTLSFGATVVAVFALLTRPVALGPVIVRSSPPMTGIADTPKTVKSGDFLAYVIKQTDKDTYNQRAFAPQVGLLEDIDPECNMEPIAIRSLKPFGIGRRGSDLTATWTYDVVGGVAPVQAPTVKIDE